MIEDADRHACGWRDAVWLHVDIDDEDSLSERLNMTAASGGVDIAVIRLPHISNFTDFSAFERMPNVSLRYVQKKEQLGMPDMIILPGTKNTMDDLTWLRESGLEGMILRHVEMKVPVVGICGGYQMMGAELTDPDNVEHGGTMRGMGLLNTKTIFETSKTRTQIHGKVHNCAGYFEKMNGITSPATKFIWDGRKILAAARSALNLKTDVQMH